MSTHAAVVYFARCEECGKKGPFRDSQTTALVWLANHTRQKHKKKLVLSRYDKMAAVGDMPQLSH